MSDEPDGSDERLRDRARTRRAWWIAGIGVALGLVLALVLGALGASGTDGLRVALLVSALATAVAGLYATVTLLVDDLRGRTIGKGRPITAGVLFLATALLMAMVAGSGG
ncbi:MAG: hypothetical protein R3320_02490 [Nitriliruptorales bacterium]|nr:hypothetical protein [Nitriliruptorales bacterium]